MKHVASAPRGGEGAVGSRPVRGLCYGRPPMPFSELIGQDRALATLRLALGRGTFHHAYLFGGPVGVGKGTAARLLAQAANCQEVGTHTLEPEACGSCPSCRKIAHGTHPDVILLSQERTMAKAGLWEPRGGRVPSKDIVVDQVRDLLYRRLAMKRFEGRRRFVIIDPADAMNHQAQNALLKTLEEPPPDTTLLLIAASPDLLIPTVRSRCARVAFVPLPDEVLVARLSREGRSPEEARVTAALAAGSLGRALALGAKELVAREQAVETVAGLTQEDAAGYVAFARDQGQNREAAREACELVSVWLRDVLATQAAGEAAPLALSDLAARTRTAASSLRPIETLRRLECVREALAALEQNAAPVLALERMLIGWFHGELR